VEVFRREDKRLREGTVAPHDSQDRTVSAVPWPTAKTVNTLVTDRIDLPDDALAPKVRGAFLDDAHELMAKNATKRIHPGHEPMICGTDPCLDEGYPDLTVPWGRNGQILPQRQPLVFKPESQHGEPEYTGAHARSMRNRAGRRVGFPDYPGLTAST